MATLYELLGLSQEATSEQVTASFNSLSEKMQSGSDSEQDAVKLMAIKEAFRVLSSPVHRQAYDAKLRKTSQVTWEKVEAAPASWLTIVTITAILVIGAIYFFKNQANQARVERLALEEAKKAEALAQEARRAESEQVNVDAAVRANAEKAKAEAVRAIAEADMAKAQARITEAEAAKVMAQARISEAEMARTTAQANAGSRREQASASEGSLEDLRSSCATDARYACVWIGDSTSSNCRGLEICRAPLVIKLNSTGVSAVTYDMPPYDDRFPSYRAGCVGYRTDLGGTKAGAVALANLLGNSDYYVVDRGCSSAGYKYNVIRR